MGVLGVLLCGWAFYHDGIEPVRWVSDSEEETLETNGSLEDAGVRVSSTAQGLELHGGSANEHGMLHIPSISPEWR